VPTKTIRAWLKSPTRVGPFSCEQKGQAGQGGVNQINENNATTAIARNHLVTLAMAHLPVFRSSFIIRPSSLFVRVPFRLLSLNRLPVRHEQHGGDRVADRAELDAAGNLDPLLRLDAADALLADHRDLERDDVGGEQRIFRRKTVNCRSEPGAGLNWPRTRTL